MHLLWKFIIILIIIGTSCLTPALLIYFNGFGEELYWNNNAVETKCNVTNNEIKTEVCYYQCHCINKGGKRKCQNCHSNCYNGYIYVEYMVSRNEFYAMLEVISHDNDYTNLENKLNEEYPVGYLLTCYYNKKNPNDVRLELENIDVYLAFFIFFCVVGGFILFGWISYEIYALYRRRNSITYI
ncbi:putative orfan [Tupanvirus soda lake]|uniref:Orfan n=2 Tax=Tupanvirus TaxID=2094720 RepID=A0AC62AB72_9VIRU|nr:putative orfan [Tupanvirus soda lake]QKU34947.1 putative orfan [Tupanvirus soda lake]